MGRGRSRCQPPHGPASTSRSRDRWRPRRGVRRASRAAGSSRPCPRATAPGPAASRRRRGSRRRGGPRPSRHPTNSTGTPPHSSIHRGRQRGAGHRDLMVKCSPTQTDLGCRVGARHPISGPTCSRPEGARSDFRASSPGLKSADPLAATSAEPGTTGPDNPHSACSPGPVRHGLRNIRPTAPLTQRTSVSRGGRGHLPTARSPHNDSPQGRGRPGLLSGLGDAECQSYQGRPCSTTVFSSVISATARRGPSFPYPLPLRPP